MNFFPIKKNRPLANFYRRSFIRSSLSFAIAASTLNISTVALAAQHSHEDKILSLVNNKLSAISIGRLILSSPHKSNLQFTSPLVSIMNDLDLTVDSLNSTTKATLSTRFNQQNARDFDQDRIINVNGWVIGLTEARLCVLATQKYS